MRNKTWHSEWHAWIFFFFFFTDLLEKTEIKRCRWGRDFITRIHLYTYFKISRKSYNLTNWHQIKACRHKFCFWTLICKGKSTRGAHFGGFIRNYPGICTRSKVTLINWRLFTAYTFITFLFYLLKVSQEKWKPFKNWIPFYFIWFVNIWFGVTMSMFLNRFFGRFDKDLSTSVKLFVFNAMFSIFLTVWINISKYNDFIFIINFK